MLSVGDFVARYTYKYSRSFLTSEAIINIILNIKSFFVEYHIESMLESCSFGYMFANNVDGLFQSKYIYSIINL